MRRFAWRAGALAVAVTMGGSSVVSAKEPAATLAALKARVKPGTEIDVLDRYGRIVRGQFVRADDEGVLISGYGGGVGSRVPAADVMSVTRRGHSLKKGMLIGAGFGILAGINVVSRPESERVNCVDGVCRPWCTSDACNAGVAVAGAAMFTAIGAGIGRMITDPDVVYRTPSERVSWSVTPHPVPRGAGVRLALRF